MVTNSKKPSSVKQKNVPKRSFYRLAELVGATILNKEKYTLDDLLDFAASGPLTLSFPVSDRYVVAGDYEDLEEVFEPPHPDEVFNGLLPLSKDAVWKIISEGKVTIEYLFCNKYEFKKLLPDSGNAYPVIETSQLMVTVEDWARFTGGLPPEPKYPERTEDPKIIGTLAYLYAESVNKPEFFTKNGRLVVEKVVENICALVSDCDGKPIHGMGPSTVHEKISKSISSMEPKIIKLQSDTPSI